MNLSRRALPAPISVPASGQFFDNDGSWSTITFDVGSSSSNGPQSFDGIVSMSSYQVWLPTPEGCESLGSYLHAPANCPLNRGIDLFNGTQSLGYVANRSTSVRSKDASGSSDAAVGALGNSTNIFGYTYGSSGLLWEDSVKVGGFRTPTGLVFDMKGLFPYLPTFGIAAGTTNLNGEDIPSPIQLLSSDSQIPSTSWGFTAGASYRHRLASLVLGGYDQAQIRGLYQEHNMTDRGFEVVLSSASIVYNNGSGDHFFASKFPAILDSTLPYLYLPNTTVDWLVDNFHLSEPASRGFFYYNATNTEASNRTLVNVNSLMLSIAAANTSTNGSVPITLPLIGLTTTISWTWNLTTWPLVIFPIRRAVTPYAILGRAFMQEAYVIADFDRRTFGISQVVNESRNESIIPIYSEQYLKANPGLTNIVPTAMDAVSHGTYSDPGVTSNSSSTNDSPHGLAPGAIAGVVISCLAAFMLSLAVYWFLRRKRKHRGPDRQQEDENAYVKPELDASAAPVKEAMSNSVVEIDDHYEGAQLDVPFQPQSPVELDGASRATQLPDDPEERHHA